MVLDELGTRICVMGPSNSGKSTLAVAIGRTSDLPVVHLDQLRHARGSNWLPRPNDEFVSLHDRAVGGDRWVIEGNYSELMDFRLVRATGLILLDASPGASVFRYVRRTVGSRPRVGGLDGTDDRLNFSMIRYILGAGHENRIRYRELFDQLSLPKVFLPNRRALTQFYRDERLAADVRGR